MNGLNVALGEYCKRSASPGKHCAYLHPTKYDEWYKERTAKYQLNEHKTRSGLMQTLGHFAIEKHP